MVDRIRSRSREPSRSVKKRRPRTLRHWAKRDPGSDGWWRQVRRLGVSRAEVELTLKIAAGGGALAEIDPHSLSPGPSKAEQLVSYMLLAHYAPTYGALMYVVHDWSHLGRSLKEWLVTSYAQMIDDDDPGRQEAALYSLWVDYFEVPARARFVFPRLLRQVHRRDALLASSGPVPWALKREAYQQAVHEPALHASLARGLLGSFYDVMGSVEPVEARALFRSIVVEDAAVAAALESIITTPIRWRLIGLIRVDETDARWRKWLPEDAGPSFLVLLSPHTTPRWVPRSDLLHGKEWIGRLLHWGFPFDEAIAHDRELVPHTGPEPVLFRIEGDIARARAAMGAEVEAWPPGLGPSEGD